MQTMTVRTHARPATDTAGALLVVTEQTGTVSEMTPDYSVEDMHEEAIRQAFHFQGRGVLQVTRTGDTARGGTYSVGYVSDAV